MAGNAVVSNQEIVQPWLNLDRYILSTFVGHDAALRDANVDFSTFAIGVGCRGAAITVLLECYEDSIVERLRHRGEAGNSLDAMRAQRQMFHDSISRPEFKWLVTFKFVAQTALQIETKPSSKCAV